MGPSRCRATRADRAPTVWLRRTACVSPSHHLLSSVPLTSLCSQANFWSWSDKPTNQSFLYLDGTDAATTAAELESKAAVARKAAGAAIDELLCMPPKRRQPQKHDDTDTDDEAKVFKIEEKVYKGSGSATDVTVKVLSNTATGESVEVLQSWGGKLERVALCKPSAGGECPGKSAVRDVIASRCEAGDPNCTAATLQGDSSLGALLIPFANRIFQGRYLFGGVEHRLTDDNSTASHGFLIQGRPMQEVSTLVTAEKAELVLGVLFDGSDQGYPFRVAVNVTYVLSAKSKLSVRVRARNDMSDGSPAPFMAGCHPYFRLLNSDFGTAKLELDRCSGWNRQLQTDGQVPNGKTQRFLGFNGSDALGDSHTGCPACGAPPHWDDGFTPTADRAECPSLTMLVHDGDDTLSLCALSLSVLTVACHADDVRQGAWSRVSVCSGVHGEPDRGGRGADELGDGLLEQRGRHRCAGGRPRVAGRVQLGRGREGRGLNRSTCANFCQLPLRVGA